MTTSFALTEAELRHLAEQALEQARALGASDAACEVSESAGLSVTTRMSEVETIENTRDKGFGITVYNGRSRGHASSSDFSPAAIRQTAEAAWNIARVIAEDSAAGLPADDELERAPRGLDLLHPWALDADEAIAIAQRCERAALGVSRQVVNSEGANVSTYDGHFVLANTHGFTAGYAYSRHSISVSPIARNRSGMQRDDWYTSSRVPGDLAAPEAVGDYAARRALSRLSARKLATRQCPVLFEAPVACGLLGHFVQAASGGALYRNASFLVNALGERIFADHVTIREDPFIARASGSSPFDDEGVAGQQRDVVAAGVLKGYFLSTYSARKLGMKTTGNAGGSHNLELLSAQTAPGDGFDAMLRRLDRGLLVTELIGQGVNYVTGDYSRGASGFWVEGGKVRYPVEEITIAGNLRQMFERIVAVGADRIVRGSKTSGSVILDGLTVGGS